MDACPLLITSIVAVKPEDQGTFFQDFLGLSGYLCSIGGFYPNTALLRTRNAQKTRRVPTVSCTSKIPLSGVVLGELSISNAADFSVLTAILKCFTIDIQDLAPAYKCYEMTFVLDTQNNHDKIASVSIGGALC